MWLCVYNYLGMSMKDKVNLDTIKPVPCKAQGPNTNILAHINIYNLI